MNDRLEQFVLDHKEEFDVFEPAPDLWDKIKKPEKKGRVIDLKWARYAMRAAAVVLIFALAFSISEYRHSNDKEIVAVTETAIKQEKDANLEIPELVEAEMYYTSQINTKLSFIKKHTASFPGLEEQVELDLSELDNVLLELKDDLEDNIATKEVIEAMIQNYRLKLHVLEEMIQLIEKSQTTDDKKSQNENINHI